MKKFFDYIQLPNFDIAADAAATFKVEPNWQNHSLIISFVSILIEKTTSLQVKSGLCFYNYYPIYELTYPPRKKKKSYLRS
jgi:hypothetical protein